MAISRYLEAIGFDGYWSGNDIVRPFFLHRFPGVECQPKVAGTNSLRTHTRCAFFYSNKPQEADEPIMEVLGAGFDDIRRSREDEDIIQFICRGMLRDGTFGATYEVHLYSEDQAERLKDYLVNNGISDDVRLVAVEAAGIMDVKRPEPKIAARDRVEVDPLTVQVRAERRRVQAQERSQRKRDRDKALKVANGTARGPGRPTKAERAHQIIIAEHREVRCEEIAEGLISTDIRLRELPVWPQSNSLDETTTAAPSPALAASTSEVRSQL